MLPLLVKPEDHMFFKNLKIKILGLGLIDACLCFISFWMACSLRFETWVWWEQIFWIPSAVGVFILWVAFGYSGIYQEMLRHLGFSALIKLFRCIGFYFFCYFTLITVIGIPGIPRTIGVMQPTILFILVVGVRLVIHFLFNPRANRVDSESVVRVAIYGAGIAGRQLSAAIKIDKRYRLVCFFDDNQKLHAKRINGVLVHLIDSFEKLLDEYKIEEIIIAMPSISKSRRFEIINYFAAYSVHVKALPELFKLKDIKKVDISDLKELDIGDLLGRGLVDPDEELLNINVQNKVILISGAGGSIGSEICRQIMMRKPKILLLAELNEFALYRIHSELLSYEKNTISSIEIIPILVNVQDEVSMSRIMSAWKIDTFYHTAAYKHVPMVERNLLEGVKNNIFGTWVCANLALKYGVSNFILISTDKAVRPTNAMGATKRIAELILKYLTLRDQTRTKFSMVRFGNVLASSGSVVPLFREQIMSGGPVTVTHRDVTRYFMTIEEAAQLVIQAGAMSVKGGEIFILDMGEPVEIYELAKRMIELSGKKLVMKKSEFNEIEIHITGLRPGEKLYEELLVEGSPDKTTHPLIMVSREVLDANFVNLFSEELERLFQVTHEGDHGKVIDCLSNLVEEYSPHHEIIDSIFKENYQN